MAKNYLKPSDAERVEWWQNFMPKVEAYQTTLDLTDPDVATVLADGAMFIYLVTKRVPAMNTAAKAQRSYKNLIADGPIGTPAGAPPALPTVSAPPATVPAGIWPRTRALVQRIKRAANYTEAIGTDLWIIGTDEEIDPNTAKPTFTATALSDGEVRLKWVKGAFDGVVIEGRAPGAATWIALGIDHFSPFVDTRDNATPGQPEVREYRMRYLEKDDQIGEWSDVVSVTTKP